MKNLAFLIAAIFIACSAAAQPRTPLNRAFLQSNMDGNNFSITNLASVTAGEMTNSGLLSAPAVATDGAGHLIPATVSGLGAQWATVVVPGTNTLTSTNSSGGTNAYTVYGLTDTNVVNILIKALNTLTNFWQITAPQIRLTNTVTVYGRAFATNGFTIGSGAGTDATFYNEPTGVAGFVMNSAGLNWGKIQNDGADLWSLAYDAANHGQTLGTPVLQWSPSVVSLLTNLSVTGTNFTVHHTGPVGSFGEEIHVASDDHYPLGLFNDTFSTTTPALRFITGNGGESGVGTVNNAAFDLSTGGTTRQSIAGDGSLIHFTATSSLFDGQAYVLTLHTNNLAVLKSVNDYDMTGSWSNPSFTNSYLHIGGREFGVGVPRAITFGYGLPSSVVYPPAWIAFTDTNVAGFTDGRLSIGTRGVTTDTPATERLAIEGNGDISLSGSLMAYNTITNWLGTNSAVGKLASLGTTYIPNGFPGVFYQQNIAKAFAKLNSAGSYYGSIQNDSADRWSLGYEPYGTNQLGTNVLSWFPAGVRISGLLGVGTEPSSSLDVRQNGTSETYVARLYQDNDTPYAFALFNNTYSAVQPGMTVYEGNDGTIHMGTTDAKSLNFHTAGFSNTRFSIDGNGVSTFSSNVVVNAQGLFYIGNTNSMVIGKLRSTTDLSGSWTTPAFTNSYLQLGGLEYGSIPRAITFGYGYGAGVYPPAWLGYLETDATASTKGQLLFATRNVTSDTAPTVRFAIEPTGQLTAWGQIMASNNIIVDAAHVIYVSNATPSRVAMIRSDNSVTNASATSSANTLLTSDGGGIAAGGANTVLHGTSPPAYSAVVEADQTLSDVTTKNVSTSAHGYMPKALGTTSEYADANGGYSQGSLLTNNVTWQVANYNILISDTFVLLSGNHTATLPDPTAAGQSGKWIYIQCSSAGTNAILRNASETLNGSSGTGLTKITNTAVGKMCGLYSNRTNWWYVQFP